MRLFLSLFFLFCACTSHAGQPALSPELTSALVQMNNGQLIEAYDTVLEYAESNPDSPEATFMLALSKWKMMWISNYDQEDRKEFLELLEKTEKLIESSIEEDNDALFFYTAIIGLRAQFAATENEWWETAQLGKKMKSHAERLIERDPEYNEAYYFLGSFNYFADALPSYIKFLRTFLFLPGGDRSGGLKQLITAYEKGNLVSVEAGRTLAAIYTYYEKIPRYGIQMSENVLHRYPGSFDMGLYKGINLYYQSEFEASESWLRKVRSDILEYSSLHGISDGKAVDLYKPMEREVRYWIARCLIQQGKPEEAEEVLNELKTPEIHQPWWIMRGVYLSLAQIAFTNKDPEQSKEYIDQVLTWSEAKDSHDKARLLRKKKEKIGTFEIDFY